MTDNWKLILTWLLNNQVEVIELENWLFTNSLDMFNSKLDIAEGEMKQKIGHIEIKKDKEWKIKEGKKYEEHVEIL